MSAPDKDRAEAPGRREVVWTSSVSLASLLGALYLTQVASLPRALRQDLDDTASHFGLGVLVAGCLICLVHALGLRKRRLVVGGLAATFLSMAFLVATELLQAPSIARQPEVGDAVADIAGAALIAVILLVAFRAQPPVPRLASAGFTGAAAVALVAVAVAVAINPATPVRERRALELQASVAEANPCISDSDVPALSAADRPLGVGPMLTEPVADPLLRFHLAEGFDQVGGMLPGLGLSVVGSAEWSPGVGAVFDGGDDGLTSIVAAEELLSALSSRERFSVDVWVDLDPSPQLGPARIVALSAGTRRDESIFHLGVEGDQLSVRFKTDCDPVNWVLVEGLADGLRHVALTYDQGQVRVFIDGRERAAYRLVGSDLSQWPASMPLNIGNETTGNRGLRGVVSNVSFWPSALSDGEVAWLASRHQSRTASDS